MNFWREFRLGASVLIFGFQALFQVPRIKRTLAIPLLLSLGFFWLGLILGVPQISHLVSGAMVWLSISNAGWMAILYWLMSGFLWVGLLMVGLILIYIVTLVLMAPIYAIMAEKTLKHGNEPLPQVQGLGEWIFFQLRLVQVSLTKACLFLIFSVLLFFVSFVPGLSFLCGFIGFLLISCDLLDYSLEAKGFSFAQRVNFFRKHKYVLMGMAGVLSLTVLIPGLTFFLLPIGVIGAARVFLQLRNDSSLRAPTHIEIQTKR